MAIPTQKTDTVELDNYHLVLLNGEERNVTAVDVRVQEGWLVCRNKQGAVVLMYAPNQVAMCEQERLDDRG